MQPLSAGLSDPHSCGSWNYERVSAIVRLLLETPNALS